MSSQNIEDTRFQEILDLEGISLQEFFQEVPNTDLFVDAQTYPIFFNDNLVSPNRVLKQFLNNPQSNIRIFYLQLFRLGYEIQSQTHNNRDFIVRLRRIIFHPDFEILFTQQTQDQRNLFNDFQFKRLFAEFIILLERQQFLNVEEIISHYPIIDTIFIHIFRSLLASQNINEQFDGIIPSQIVFGQLCSLLSLTITSYGNCWKFQDSDMFCYDDGDNQLYLAYIIQDDQVSESQEQIQQQIPSSNPKQLYHNPNVQINRNNPVLNIIPANNVPAINYQTSSYTNTQTINHNEERPNKHDYSSSSNYNVNDYFSKNHIVHKSENNRQEFVYNYKQPQYKKDTTFYNNNNNYQSTLRNNYNNYQSSRNNNYSNYGNISENTTFQQNTYVSTFKPVQLTPMPVFNQNKTSFQSKKQYRKPTTSYQYNNDFQLTQPSSSYSSSVFDSNNTYKSIPITTSGDYFSDFTPPAILSKLRSNNRDNINKIRQAMKGISRGVDLPPDFDLKKSAVYNTITSSSVSKQQLYSNQSNSQFEYNNYNKLDNYSYKPRPNYQQSYSSQNKPFY